MVHCLQYASVGRSERIDVYGTERMTDDEILAEVAKCGVLPIPATITRYDRCPECEVWTRVAGQPRSIDCPALAGAVPP